MILLPIIIIQMVTIIIFYERHWENVSNHMENYLIAEIKTIIKYYTKYSVQNSVLKDLNQLDLKITLLDHPNTYKKVTDSTLEHFQKKLKANLNMLPKYFI